MMDTASEADHKLNVFALPSQTSIIFGLIVAVLLGTVFAGSIGPSPTPLWPLAIGLLLLPLRELLARPEREFARYGLSAAGDALDDLQRFVENQAKAIDLRRTPKLVTSSDERLRQPRTFGTPRRWYIALDHDVAHRMQEGLADPDIAPQVEAKLIHELYHFKTGDYWQLGYARELLRITFLLMIWAATFLCGLGLLLLIAAPDFVNLDLVEQFNQIETLTPEMREMIIRIMPSQAAIDQVRQKAAEINLSLVINFAVSATLPFVIIGGLLRALFWPKLWRMRELYADAGIVHTQGDVKPYLSALTRIPLTVMKRYPSVLSVGQETSDKQTRQIASGIKDWWQKVREMFKHHPDTPTRIKCIKNPGHVFDPWFITALRVGSLALLLDILLSSPLTLLYVGSWPMHFSTLMIMVIVALSIIPPIVQGRPVWTDLVKIVAFAMTLRLGWLLFTIGLLMGLLVLAPGVLDQMLAYAVAATAHFAGHSEQLGFDDLTAFVIEAAVLNIAQVFIIAFVLVSSLILAAFLLRRLLTWYSLPHASQRLMKIAYGIIGVAALCVGLAVLPLLTTMLLNPADLLKPITIGLAFLSLIVTVISLVFFLKFDKQYAMRCPVCGAEVEGTYRIGKSCNTCSELLHPWLIVRYKV